jgi:hypothetical protein
MTAFQRGSLAARNRQIDNTAVNQEANRELAGKRVNIAEFKANNPNKRFMAVKGGNIMAFDPLTGEAEDTGISSGSLTDQERLEITQSNTEKNETTRQGNRLEVVNTQHGNRMTEKQYDKDNPDDEWSNPVQTFNPDGSAALIIQVNKKDGKTRVVQTPAGSNLRPNAPGAKDELLPSQQINARKLKVQEVLARNPNWSRYINAETGEVLPVGTGIGGADLTEEVRNKIVEALYGSADNGTPNTSTPSGSSVSSDPKAVKAPPLPPGYDPNVWEYVPKPGGGWTAQKKGGGE